MTFVYIYICILFIYFCSFFENKAIIENVVFNYLQIL